LHLLEKIIGENYISIDAKWRPKVDHRQIFPEAVSII
jgi:hypothetical protein